MVMVFIHWLLLLAVFGASAATSLHVVKESKRNNTPPPSPFVSTIGSQFIVNGSQFKFIGTTAYWLPALNNDQDIDDTLAAIKAANFTVVRLWAFNDVETVPENGTWFQTFQNGSLVINEGPNGLQRLDKVIELAQKHGLYVLLSLTNNWNPTTNRSQPLPQGSNSILARQLLGSQDANLTNATTPRNFLSNDYGGMDFYVRNFNQTLNGTSSTPLEHSQFFVNPLLIKAFSNYTTRIASRYANHTNLLAWELANDARCNSTIPTSDGCEARNVTKWHSTLARVVRDADPNHLVSSGSQGYLCVDCPKLFPRVTPPAPPPPQTSPAPGARRRSQLEPLSRAGLLNSRKAAWKRERTRQKRAGQLRDGPKIRGRWTASPAKRQSSPDVGLAFDGSAGVDSEDILNIPSIGFSSFQFFPDQFDYSTGDLDEDLPFFNKTLETGKQWIQRQGEIARLFNKPVSLTGFGLVTSDNLGFWVPFNSSIAPFGPDQVNNTNVTVPSTVTDAQRDEAYREWIIAALNSGVEAIIHYQWSQDNLTIVDGSTISPTSPTNDASPQNPIPDHSGTSPNDGYGILGQGEAQALESMSAAFQPFASDQTN